MGGSGGVRRLGGCQQEGVRGESSTWLAAMRGSHNSM